jgi:hypothetical protein
MLKLIIYGETKGTGSASLQGYFRKAQQAEFWIAPVIFLL